MKFEAFKSLFLKFYPCKTKVICKVQKNSEFDITSKHDRVPVKFMLYVNRLNTFSQLEQIELPSFR